MSEDGKLENAFFCGALFVQLVQQGMSPKRAFGLMADDWKPDDQDQTQINAAESVISSLCDFAGMSRRQK